MATVKGLRGRPSLTTAQRHQSNLDY